MDRTTRMFGDGRTRAFIVVQTADGGLVHIELGYDWQVNIDEEREYPSFYGSDRARLFAELLGTKRTARAYGSVLNMGWQEGAPEYGPRAQLPEPEFTVKFAPPLQLEHKPNEREDQG